eukprot:jgi/Botrbrau1/10289/Bobra.0120s0011.1
MTYSISRPCLIYSSQPLYRRASAHTRTQTRGNLWNRRWPTRHIANVYLDEQGIEHYVAFETEDEESWDSKYGEDAILDFGVSIEQGPRDTMEDFVTIVPKARCGFLFAGVFDGHGGTVAAEYLSVNLYWVFSESLDEDEYGKERPVSELDGRLRCPTHFTPVLADAFQGTDQALLKWLNENVTGDDTLAGSTATVALVRRDKIVVANVGDSRAVLCRNGSAVDLSTEHRVYGRGETVEKETERVESVGGWVGDGRVCDVLGVSRAFGDREFKGSGLKSMLEKGVESEYWDQEFADSVNFTGIPSFPIPDVIETAVLPDDEFLILASDGLWDVVTSAEQ